MQVFRKKMEFWKNKRKCPWALMRRTRIPNIIPIKRWERGEKLREPKTGEKSGEPNKPISNCHQI